MSLKNGGNFENIKLLYDTFYKIQNKVREILFNFWSCKNKYVAVIQEHNRVVGNKWDEAENIK